MFVIELSMLSTIPPLYPAKSPIVIPITVAIIPEINPIIIEDFIP